MIAGKPVVYLVGDDAFTGSALRAISNRFGLRVLPYRGHGERPLHPWRLEALRPDLIVLLGYMDRVPDDVLERYHVLGFHPSLLPQYRGGSAVKWQLHDLERADDADRRFAAQPDIPGVLRIRIGPARPELGATIYRLLPGAKMDSGPVAAQERLVAPDPLTAGSLYRSAQDAGITALVRALAAYLDGTYHEVEQDEALATWHPRLRPGQSPAEYLDAAHRTPLEAHA